MFIIMRTESLSSILLLSIFLFSCGGTNKEFKNQEAKCSKKLQELIFPEELLDSLSDDLKIYKENYLSIYQEKMFVMNGYYDGLNTQLKIYATNDIKDEFKYEGYIVCEGFILVLVDVGVKLDFYQKKNNFKEFSCIQLLDSENIQDPYMITYILKEDSFFRRNRDYIKNFKNREKLDTAKN